MQGLRAFHRMLDFSGRSGRAEYWQFFAIMAVAVMTAAVVDYARDPYAAPFLPRLVVMATLLPHIAVAVRRLHDRSRSAWWVGVYAAVVAASYVTVFLMSVAETASTYDGLEIALGGLLLITIGLGLFLLIQFMLPGDDHANRYGPVDAGGTANSRSEPYQPPLIAGAPTSPRSVPAAQPQQSASKGDPLEQIERLSKLKAAGALTDDEFAAQKALLLKRL